MTQNVAREEVQAAKLRRCLVLGPIYLPHANHPRISCVAVTHAALESYIRANNGQTSRLSKAEPDLPNGRRVEAQICHSILSIHAPFRKNILAKIPQLDGGILAACVYDTGSSGAGECSQERQ